MFIERIYTLTNLTAIISRFWWGMEWARVYGCLWLIITYSIGEVECGAFATFSQPGPASAEFHFWWSPEDWRHPIFRQILMWRNLAQTKMQKKYVLNRFPKIFCELSAWWVLRSAAFILESLYPWHMPSESMDSYCRISVIAGRLGQAPTPAELRSHVRAVGCRLQLRGSLSVFAFSLLFSQRHLS